MKDPTRHHRTRNWAPHALMASVLVVVVLSGLLFWEPRQATAVAEPLFVYCAASQKGPLEAISRQYEAAYGVKVNLQFGASQSLLANAEVSQTGDLFIPADDSYLVLAAQKQLTREVISLANMKAILVVAKGNPLRVTSLTHLLTTNARVAQANPGVAAIGKLSRETLTKQGQWAALEKKTVVFAGTVNDVANNIAVGAADAGIIWDAMLGQYPALAAAPAPELEGITARVAVGLLSCSKQPAAALHFARYVAAPEQGLAEYARQGYAVVSGDTWADRPELTLYAGALLKPAIEETLTRFEEREGVKVNRVYNGCGILVGQIKAGKVPDAYFACDKQFLTQVRDLFPEPVVISTNRLVILVPEGNPRHIASLADLAQPGLRVGVGHEQQCALGQLTADTFRRSGVSDRVQANIKVRVPAGDMLVNELRAGALDAAVAYLANAVNAGDFLDAVAIPNLPCSVAVQPYAVAKNARYAQLATRLRDALTSAESHERFSAYGFGWGEPPREQP